MFSICVKMHDGNESSSRGCFVPRVVLCLCPETGLEGRYLFPARFSGIALILREPLRIHFGGQANLFDSGRRQKKVALATAKPRFSSLPEYKNLLLVNQKQLLELP